MVENTNTRFNHTSGLGNNGPTTICTQISNPTISLRKLISYSMFRMIAALNPDIIESITLYDVAYDSSPSKIAIFQFKPLFPSLCATPCYMCMRIDRIESVTNNSSEKIVFLGKQYTPDGSTADPIESVLDTIRKTHIQIVYKESTTTMILIDESTISVEYIFDAQLDHPIGDTKYAKQIISKMMHRIFSRLKTGIEGVKGGE